MIREFLLHGFGLCGEPHFNLFNIGAALPGITGAIVYVKYKLKQRKKDVSVNEDI